MLHNQVSGLRQVLGRNGRLETHGSAYRLKVAPGERDVDRFEELIAHGRAEMHTDPERTSEALRKALGQRLPNYMLPARWLALEKLPKNANGKIDRRSLKEEFQLNARAAL